MVGGTKTPGWSLARLIRCIHKQFELLSAHMAKLAPNVLKKSSVLLRHNPFPFNNKSMT